jgi:hypothetical protein
MFQALGLQLCFQQPAPRKVRLVVTWLRSAAPSEGHR